MGAVAQQTPVLAAVIQGHVRQARTEDNVLVVVPKILVYLVLLQAVQKTNMLACVRIQHRTRA